MSTIVPIYNTNGVKVKELTVFDDINYTDGRVVRGKKCYYKGVGVPYTLHSLLDIPSNDDYEILKKTGIFYLGYAVRKKCFIGKTGIFQERFQPFFPDHIGSCGVKEGTIVLNSSTFKKSSVEVLDCVTVDEEYDQYYYALEYHCNRHHYVTHDGDPKKLFELLDYMITSNWNFLWDKTAIRDVSSNGLVSDVADLFVSDTLQHKLGTIYSILYSLGNIDPKKYNEFLTLNNLNHKDSRSYVFNSVVLLKRMGVDISEMLPYDDLNRSYKYIVLNYLVNGKNCAYCSCDLFRNDGERIRDQYVEKTKKELYNIAD